METDYLEQAVCLQCGVLGPDAPEMCDVCGGAVFHLSRESERHTAEYAIKSRRERRAGMAFVYAIIPGGLAAFALTYITDVYLLDYVPVLLLSLPFYPLIAQTMKRRQSAGIRYLEQHLEGVQQRFWPRLATGAPIALALGLMAVHLFAGDLADWWLVPAELLDGRDLERLWSSALVHGNAYHLLANLLGLLLFGVAVDLRIGRLVTLVLLGATATTAGLAHVYFTGAPSIPMVGASGMVYGLIGAELALMPTRKMVIAPMGMAFEIPNFVVIVLFVGVYGAFDAMASPHIAWIAHLGGFVGGVAIGLPLRAIAEPKAFLEFEEWRAEKLDNIKRSSA